MTPNTKYFWTNQFSRMTSYQFDCLNDLQKFEAWCNAEYIGRRYDANQLLECRKIDAFYVVYKINNGIYTHLRYFRCPTYSKLSLYK